MYINAINTLLVFRNKLNLHIHLYFVELDIHKFKKTNKESHQV